MTKHEAIFVIDDDPIFLVSMGRLLKAHGFEARLFSSAEAFLEADPGSASCLLLDIQLGGISGIELGRRLLRSGSPLPVLFMTASDSDAARRAAEEVGCVSYLTKPFAPSALIAALRSAVASHEMK